MCVRSRSLCVVSEISGFTISYIYDRFNAFFFPKSVCKCLEGKLFWEPGAAIELELLDLIFDLVAEFPCEDVA